MLNRGATLINHTIMKSLKTMLPALGLVFGATLAMAMNVPSIVAEKTATKIWTPDASAPNEYRDVTLIVQDQEYDCNESTRDCLVEFPTDDPADGNPIVLMEGDFVEL